MDPHFNEYLAAVAGMVETYGERADCHATEFQDEPDAAGREEPAVTVALA
jgi:hypothetical protein